MNEKCIENTKVIDFLKAYECFRDIAIEECFCDRTIETYEVEIFYRSLSLSIKDFKKFISNKKITFSDKNDIFKEIKKDIKYLDMIMYAKIKFILKQIYDSKYENLEYKLDLDLADEIIDEDEYYEKLNKCTKLDFYDLGIEEEYLAGFHNDKELGIYNVYKRMYENKCYFLFEEEFKDILRAFTTYEMVLEHIFNAYKDITKLEYYDALCIFENLHKEGII